MNKYFVTAMSKLRTYFSDVNDAKPFRVRLRRVGRFRWKKVVPYIPAIIRLTGKK